MGLLLTAALICSLNNSLNVDLICSQSEYVGLSGLFVSPQLFLVEQSFVLRASQRTLGQRVRLYLLRFILNVLVMALLAGSFCLIYFATDTSLKEVRLGCSGPEVAE